MARGEMSRQIVLRGFVSGLLSLEMFDLNDISLTEECKRGSKVHNRCSKHLCKKRKKIPRSLLEYISVRIHH